MMAKRTVIYQHCLSRRCFRETLEKAKNTRGHINMHRMTDRHMCRSSSEPENVIKGDTWKQEEK